MASRMMLSTSEISAGPRLRPACGRGFRYPWPTSRVLDDLSERSEPYPQPPPQNAPYRSPGRSGSAAAHGPQCCRPARQSLPPHQSFSRIQTIALNKLVLSKPTSHHLRLSLLIMRSSTALLLPELVPNSGEGGGKRNRCGVVRAHKRSAEPRPISIPLVGEGEAEPLSSPSSSKYWAYQAQALSRRPFACAETG
jgi:hypothetical protein